MSFLGIDKVAQSMVPSLPLSVEQGHIAVSVRYAAHTHSTQSLLDYAFSSLYVFEWYECLCVCSNQHAYKNRGGARVSCFHKILC